MARQLMTAELILSILRDTPDRLSGMTGDLTEARLHAAPDQGWSRSATVLGAGRPVEITAHSYAHRLARHERTHWRQVAKTVRAPLD